ncbi:MAG: hypothetical protein ACFFKA_14710 [Candidatus Thorarchaeota archaeon]
MYQLEKLSENCYFIKAIGNFPLPVATKFVEEFEKKTADIKNNLCVIVDITDAIFLKLESLNVILELLKRDNERLYRSAFIISNNPPLDTEFTYLLKKAESPKRKLVSTLEEAKDWVGIDKVIIEK